ncbi:MAG: lipopolysaccharide core heptose(I) kinase RfaP [Pseudomonadota bacterium]
MNKPEYYLAEHFAAGDLPRAPTPNQLLDWARRMAVDVDAADVYRDKEGRKTLRFVYRKKPYFMKLHSGVGWPEIIKNLMQLRLPVLSAVSEFQAVLALQRAGVHTLTVLAFCRLGHNPAKLKSMIVTAELTGTVKLEDYCADWATRPPSSFVKRRLIIAVADIARRMHSAGINHRDFYLCHFHLDEHSLMEEDVRCFLIDLHRAQIRDVIPTRWREKDLAGLYFSAMDLALSDRDLLRFLRHYSEGGLRTALKKRNKQWQRVQRRARALYDRSKSSAARASENSDA